MNKTFARKREALFEFNLRYKFESKFIYLSTETNKFIYLIQHDNISNQYSWVYWTMDYKLVIEILFFACEIFRKEIDQAWLYLLMYENDSPIFYLLYFSIV